MRTRVHVALPGPKRQGLAQSKTLAQMDMAIKNAKRLELRWPATVFFPRRVSSTSFRKQNRSMIYGNALNFGEPDFTECGLGSRRSPAKSNMFG
jgi:hypothetical protein